MQNLFENLDSTLQGIQHAAIFNTMRILKKLNPGDCYLENYKGHLEKSGKDFYDTYMLLWEIAVVHTPKRILEIGTRTGISLCQLLSAYVDNSVIERVLCIDPFNDGFTSPNIVLANLKYLNLPAEKVEIRKALSQEVLPALTEEFDYILVDGDHAKEAARHDLEHAARLVSPGGVIVFDDISNAPGECGLIDVWEAFKADHPESFEYNEVMSGKGVAWASKKS